MTLKGWNHSYSVGVPEMDQDHQKLLGMIGHLHQSMMGGQSNDIMADLIREMEEYAKNHFQKEERFMAQINHQDLREQKMQHKVFMDKVQEFKSHLETKKLTLAISLMPFLNEWFLDHIMKVDKRYGKS